jgi:hypothetical protein
MVMWYSCFLAEVLLTFHSNILVSIFVVEVHIFLQNVSSTVHLRMVQILKSKNNINTESLWKHKRIEAYPCSNMPTGPLFGKETRPLLYL